MILKLEYVQKACSEQTYQTWDVQQTQYYQINQTNTSRIVSWNI